MYHMTNKTQIKGLLDVQQGSSGDDVKRSKP